MFVVGFIGGYGVYGGVYLLVYGVYGGVYLLVYENDINQAFGLSDIWRVHNIYYRTI
jgi:hypothetical protein